MRTPTATPQRLAAAVLLLAACTDRSAVAPDGSPARAPRPATATATSVTSECGGQTDLRDSRVTLDWGAPSTAPGVTADAYGTYTGGQGGVHGKVFYHDAICSRSGDLVFDPDKDAAKPARKLVFNFPADNDLQLPTGVKAGPFVNFRGIMMLGSDGANGAPDGVSNGRDAKIEAKNPGAPRGWEFPALSAERPDYPTNNGTTTTPEFRFSYTGIAGCEALRYDKIRMTRHDLNAAAFVPTGTFASDGTPLGQWDDKLPGGWTVESVEPHHAQCMVTKKGNLVNNGSKMEMPFRVVASEVR
jgi:hypothetical protein